MSECCFKRFEWQGTPVGKEATLAGRDAYVTRSNSEAAIMLIHDLFGWTLPNLRLLADHYACEADATAYLADFFNGEVLPPKILEDESRWKELDMPSFLGRNSEANRQAAVFECAKALRSQYKRVGAIGFCFGGWAVFQLGAKGNNLADCISTGHSTSLEKSEIENVGVPVQILALEFDAMFTPELKEFSNKVIPTLGWPYDYQYFPGVEHRLRRGAISGVRRRCGH